MNATSARCPSHTVTFNPIHIVLVSALQVCVCSTHSGSPLTRVRVLIAATNRRARALVCWLNKMACCSHISMEVCLQKLGSRGRLLESEVTYWIQHSQHQPRGACVSSRSQQYTDCAAYHTDRWFVVMCDLHWCLLFSHMAVLMWYTTSRICQASVLLCFGTA